MQLGARADQAILRRWYTAHTQGPDLPDRLQGVPRLVSLWHMLQIDAKPIVHVMFLLGNIRQHLVTAMAGGVATIRNEGIGNADPFDLRSLRHELEKLGLDLSLLSVDRLITSATKQDADIAEILEGISRLAQVMQDQLSLSFLLAFTSAERALIEPSQFPFGSEVQAQFPSIISEVVNGSKCLGFGLPTASVFHHIRCLEAGIAAISRCLDIPDPAKGAERSWMKLLSKIKAEVDARWPAGPIRTGEAQFFEEALAVLAAAQNPYRNNTMHLDKRYDMQEAQDIKMLVSAFMRKVASRMDERGQPLA